MPPRTNSEPRNTVQAASMCDITRRHKRTAGHSAQAKMTPNNTGITTSVTRSSATTTSPTTVPISSTCNARSPNRPTVSVHIPDTVNDGCFVGEHRSFRPVLTYHLRDMGHSLGSILSHTCVKTPQPTSSNFTHTACHT